ncbi:MAG: proteasome-activating nucleotidase [Candidatus Diapherotrites archaeon]|nr:proteasome-activating nucleotidase [Candidatus Diapherotrites archaeon]
MVESRDEFDVAAMQRKVQELEIERTKLEAHAFQLQRKYAELLRELKRLKQPPLMVGFVVELLPNKMAIVRHTNGNQFVVPVVSHVYPKLRPGMKVALSQHNLAVLDILPEEKDLRARAFEVIEKPPVRYSDVGGLEKQIQELRDVVELPLKQPDLFREIGIEPPKGVLLYGPPGTGKTLLAKAVAGESEATFIHVVGSELVQKFIGEGAKLVREVFKLAREKAPSIIFIDEIDAIGGRRTDSESGGDREIQRTMIQLLAEMDGFKPLEGVVVIAATNRPDVLDPALLRPGRFDRLVYVPLPDAEARKEIFRVHLRRVKSRDLDLDELAKLTSGFTGADIRAVVTEAGLRAVKEGRNYITMEDMLFAINRFRVKAERELSKHFR